MNRLLSAVLTVIVATASITAQKNKPNFSGTWNIDKSRSTFGGLRSFFIENNQLNCSVQILIKHKEPKLSIKKTFYCDEKNDSQIKSDTTIEDTFYVDGRGEKNNGSDIVILSTKTSWLERKIIIRNRLDNSITEYSLSDEGNTLIERTYGASKTPNLNRHLSQIKRELVYNLLSN